jgi:hypothetical protein
VVLAEHNEASVEVLVDNVPRTTIARDGSFAIDQIAPGVRRITFRGTRIAVRHIAVSAEGGQSHLLLVALREAPLVVVRRPSPAFDQRMAEFRQRRRAGGGVFLDRAEIEHRNPRTLTDLLRTVPGVRVQSYGSGFRYVSAHFRRLTPGMSDDTGACDMMLYLNGQPFLADAGTADARVRVNELAALEVYVSAASVPREFAGASAACGVIVIWLGR